MRSAILISLALVACNADLTAECLPPGANCDQYAVQPATSSGTGGGGGAGPVCYDGCVTDAVSPEVGMGHEFPCDVEEVLGQPADARGCRRCHSSVQKPTSGAPFILDTWDDSQVLYGGTTIWARIHPVLRGGSPPGSPATFPADYMPLQPPKLDEPEKQILADEWACACGAPRPDGEMCN
jgi:hypothetical protein